MKRTPYFEEVIRDEPPERRPALKHHTSKHHRRPRSRGGKDDASNISRVAENKHRAWHLLFGNMEAEAIAREINTHWLDPAYFFVAKEV